MRKKAHPFGRVQTGMSTAIPAVDDASQEAPVRYVEIIGGEKDGLHFEIGPDGLLVGRSPTCDLIFDDREVSRRHAYFYHDDRSCYVEDLGSKNGVWINGTRVKKERLHDGDTVDTGPVRFAFRIGERAGLHARWLSGQRTATAAMEAPWERDVGGQSPFRHTLAASSLAFGALAYLHWAFGVGAVVLALLAIMEIRRDRDRVGLPLAMGGLAVGIVGVGMSGWFGEIAPRLWEHSAEAARSACRENLAQISLALSGYRLAHDGARPDRLQELVAEGLIESDRLYCPGCAQREGARGAYFYRPMGDDGPDDPYAIVVCDRDPAWHLGRGGWVLSRDGTVSWEPHERFLHLLSRLPGAVTVRASGRPNGAER